LRLSGILLLAALVATNSPAQTPTATTPSTKKTPSSTHSLATRTRSRAAAAKPIEGLAKVGEMPAAVGTVQTAYALKYVDLKIGTGDLALPHKFYTVHYSGWTLDGKKFDSSYDHPDAKPFTFPAGAKRVITGWDTGFEGMRIGGKRRLLVPYQLAYGESGRPPVIPEKAMLIFDIEFLAQGDAPPADPAVPTAAQR